MSGSGEFLARAAFADFAGPVIALAERLAIGGGVPRMRWPYCSRTKQTLVSPAGERSEAAVKAGGGLAASSPAGETG